MPSTGYIGIYFGKETATVLCLGSGAAQQGNLIGCFTVSVQAQQQEDGDNIAELASLIAEGCAEKLPNHQNCEAAVALDCSIFMQHNVHSEFTDLKQIASTIRFDAEEALAADIANVAIAFRPDSSDETGSGLSVFTAEKKILAQIITALQRNHIDPVTIEPDINCLARFVCRNVSVPDDSHPLFSILSDRSGYFIMPRESFEKSKKDFAGSSIAMRSFLLGPSQDRNNILARQVPLFIASVESTEQTDLVKVFDSKGLAEVDGLSQSLGIRTEKIEMAAAAAAEPSVLADCNDLAGLAIAYGAAMACLEKPQTTDFRKDFMPFEGRKKRLQKTIKIVGCSVAVIAIAFGVYFQSALIKANRPRKLLQAKFVEEYSAVMFGKKPPAGKNLVKALKKELRRIKNVKGGQLSMTGKKSVAAKLTFVLQAFNRCAAQTNLKIDKIRVTSKNIAITGSTSSMANTLKLFDAIKKTDLNIQQRRIDSKGGRNNFSVTVVPKT